jgi:hypothetical protein
MTRINELKSTAKLCSGTPILLLNELLIEYSETLSIKPTLKSDSKQVLAWPTIDAILCT